jgi:ubiquinone/menaquinone biosynthesis C-methylase UbiE
MTNEEKFEAGKDLVRARLCKFSRKAFQLLPKLDSPSILDVGCGSGVVTIELSKLCNGRIVALDIDEHALDRLDTKIKKARLSHRVSTLKRSMLDMDFANERFDIIWAEGSIHVVGFEKGLREWSWFLKPKGFLVVHDETSNIEGKLKLIASGGYDLIDYFMLDQDVWWTEYCVPLQKMIDEMQPECASEPEALALLYQNQQEIDTFKISPERYHSTFFIMGKRQ